MDTKEQAEKLKKQIAALDTWRGEAEANLAQGRAKLDAATARRSELVAELAGADEATAGWCEGELDGIDRQVTSHRRFVESHEAVLAKIAADLAPLRNELVQVAAAIQREEHEKALRAFDGEMKQKIQAASESLAAARLALAGLSSAAVRGKESLGVEADRILDPLFESFTMAQAPGILEQNGWRPALPRYRFLQFQVSAMTRG